MPGVADAVRRRGGLAQTLVLYEAENITIVVNIRILQQTATKIELKVGLLLCDDIFVCTKSEDEREFLTLRKRASEKASERWGARIEFTCA